MMFSTGVKSRNNWPSAKTQTLFDFLKRKKQNTIYDGSASHHASIPNQDINLSTSSLIDHPNHYHRNNRCKQYGNTTPIRKQSKSMSKTLLNMISPIKNKPQQHQTITINHNHNHNYQQTYTRNHITKYLTNIQSNLHKTMQNVKNINQKVHPLFIKIVTILDFVEQHAPDNIRRVAIDIKSKLKQFQKQFQEIQINDNNLLIEQFQQNLSEHLITLETQAKKQLQTQNQITLAKIRKQKDQRIIELEEQVKKSTRNLKMLEHKLEKSEQNYEKYTEQVNKKQKNYVQSKERTQQNYSIELEELGQKLNKMQGLYEKSVQKCKQLQKQGKHNRYIKQQTNKQHTEQMMKISQSKEQYLLNEIMILKNQFSQDVQKMQQLYNLKQNQNLTRINNLQMQLQAVKIQRNYDQQLSQRVMYQINNQKMSVNTIKHQNEIVISDMCRMNEQLYQHWLALKDIKTLSIRLGIFTNFVRIYQDLSFNDTLFT